MKKLSKNDLISKEGGISCDSMITVLTGLYVNNYAQYSALANSGVAFQCTNGSGGLEYYYVI